MALPQTLDLDADRVVGATPTPATLVQWHPTLRTWPLRGSWVRIGRDPECEVRVDDAATSRIHARARCAGDYVVVEDLDSRNGVFIGGRRIYGSAPVAEGQVLRVARALFTVRRLVDPPPVGDLDARAVAPTDAEPAQLPLVGGVGLRDVRRALAALARQQEPVLILGETGTGKSLAAAALAAVAGKRMFVVTGPELRPESALSTLFGHVRGAFTGADRPRDGYVKLAAGQVLFLDEIGDLPADVQAMLLGLLQEGRYRPLGADADQRATCRIVAATSLDLRARVEAGLFRADLFHRLDRRRVELPPLRDRVEDLPALICEIVERTRGRAPTAESLDPLVLERLATHPWPGNVRELENVVGKSLDAAAPGMLALHRVERCLERETVGAPRAAGPPSRPVPALRAGGAAAPLEVAPPGRRTRAVSPAELADALARAGGNRSRAARLLGIGRATLYRRLGSQPLRFDAPPSDHRREPTTVDAGAASPRPPRVRV